MAAQRGRIPITGPAIRLALDDLSRFVLSRPRNSRTGIRARLRLPRLHEWNFETAAGLTRGGIVDLDEPLSANTRFNSEAHNVRVRPQTVSPPPDKDAAIGDGA